MKDLGGVLVNGDSSSTNSSTLDNSGDDDYVFTEDQRRAALELQSLYRKLGLEDLDDGFEEGLSAYDDPHFDIVARLHEVNSRFEEDETPLESDRQRKVRFKETVVDLIVPISPVRNSRSPPEYDYAEYDDDFEDDFNTDELRDMIDSEELTTRNDLDDQLENVKDEEYDAENFVPASDIETSTTELFFPVNMVNEGEMKKEQTYVDNETKEGQADVEDRNNGKQGFDEDEIKDERSYNQDENNEGKNANDEELKEENSYDDDEESLKNSFDEDEDIHIRKISTELEDVTDNDECSNSQSSVKPLENETETLKSLVEVSQSVVEIPYVSGLVSDTAVTSQAQVEGESSQDPVSQVEQSLEVSEQKVGVCEPIETPKEICVSSENNEINKSVPYDQKSVPPLGTKPKRPSRMSSPPTKPRSTIKKSSPGPVLRTSVPIEVRQTSAPPIKSGNSRSRYGLTEELRQELRRLKLLEAAQKKHREQEQAEERRRRQEDADSAFKAWLEMKKRTKSASSNSGRDPNVRSPTRKDRESKGAKEENVEAFQAWLEQKRRQDNRDRIFQQLQRQHEAAVNESQRGRKDSSRKVYRAWLRRKNIQQRQQSLNSIQQGGTVLSASFPQNLPRALQQAQMLNRTYQAYLGSTLWAALAGIKHHPAAFI